MLCFCVNREDFSANVSEWKLIFDNKEPQKQILPLPWSEKLSDFQRMTVIRCLRPDKVFLCISMYIFSIINFKGPNCISLASFFVVVYFILSRLLYLAFSANLGLLCMPHPYMGSLV